MKGGGGGGGVGSFYNRGTVVVTDGSHSPSLTVPVQHALGRLHLPVPLNRDVRKAKEPHEG